MKAVAEQVEGDWTDGRWNRVDVGPFMSASVHTPHGRTLKGIAIKVGSTTQATTVCFNTELLGYSAAWADGFLEFDWVHSVQLNSFEDLCSTIHDANKRKAISPTQFNHQSTRGHCIMQVCC